MVNESSGVITTVEESITRPPPPPPPKSFPPPPPAPTTTIQALVTPTGTLHEFEPDVAESGVVNVSTHSPFIVFDENTEVDVLPTPALHSSALSKNLKNLMTIIPDPPAPPSQDSSLSTIAQMPFPKSV
jgi:hypothetical protein